MNVSIATSSRAKNSAELDYDAIIIGAGVSGLYQLYRLRELGLRVRVIDKAEGVGGTWYWNKYPGCRFDSESFTYGYSFSRELLDEWTWSERFAPQPETESYLNYVADKFDMRRDIQLNCTVTAAHYQEKSRSWNVILDNGERLSTRFLFTAVGILTVPTLPSIEGVNSFKGEAYHTARWPKTPVSFDGKRVAVIGTGSTGVQIIQEASKTASHVTVFQRTPNWCAPLNNSKISSEEMQEIRQNYSQIFARCNETNACFIHDTDPRSAHEVTPEEREAFFEKLYGEPGFGIWLGNFRDILRDKNANDLISDFIARKIRQRVKDPAVAERLIPKNHGFGTRRVPLETNYYEIYNQPNVKLIDLNETPIKQVMPYGIKTSDAEYEFDMIVYATGFDAITGAFDAMDIRGVGGYALKDKWQEGPETFLGMMVDGFPNFFMVLGPHTAIGNFPRSTEYVADWLTGVLGNAFAQKATRIEANPEGVAEWMAVVAKSGEGHLSNGVRSWFVGINTNLEGRQTPRMVRYFGTNLAFREYCDAVAAKGYAEILMD